MFVCKKLSAKYTEHMHKLSYLFPHGHAPWGDDDISAADSLIQSVQQVIRAAGNNRCHKNMIYSLKDNKIKCNNCKQLNKREGVLYNYI